MESSKDGGVSKFQAFVTETVHRTAFKNAGYNPRHMPQAKRIKLREALQAVGLVQPIVWNKTTGNIVGGHQRIAQLDALEGSANYSLTVAVVEVGEAREKELNVLLNNQEVCGEFDLEKLKVILTAEITLENTGFDHAEFMKLFGEAPGLSAAGHQEALSKQLANVKEAYKKLEAMSRGKDDTDFYNVVVFGSWNERKEFLEEFGFEDNRYINGHILTQILRDFKKPKSAAQGKEANGAGILQEKSEGAGKPT